MLAMAEDEGLEPSYLDLEANVLAAGRISRKHMAEPTGVEPVPADRQSAILPIDHSSGSLPWTRTTISAFRAQRPSIGRRGNLDLVKELVVGTMTPIRASSARFKVQSPATDDPSIKLAAVSPSCTVRTTPRIHRGCSRDVCDRCEHSPQVHGDLRRDRNTARTQARFQNHQVQSFACS